MIVQNFLEKEWKVLDKTYENNNHYNYRLNDILYE
jgi:hypothetical protein